ncbi:hypothetical protein [Saccharothrix xinjiangensis]|uniref:Uncharacterized protein n=1 Tax=Saccharothrix xinjiangensis TaxID=204798 RepID=A0ABV9XXG7_9PSEU
MIGTGGAVGAALVEALAPDHERSRLHLVHLGVSAAGNTTVVHFAWHQLVEAHTERSGLDHTHLRPAAFMQNLRFGVGEP